LNKLVPPWISTKLFCHGDAKVGGKGTEEEEKVQEHDGVVGSFKTVCRS